MVNIMGIMGIIVTTIVSISITIISSFIAYFLKRLIKTFDEFKKIVEDFMISQIKNNSIISQQIINYDTRISNNEDDIEELSKNQNKQEKSIILLQQKCILNHKKNGQNI